MVKIIEMAVLVLYYIKLDLQWGFNLVKMRKGNEEKATFVMV